MEKRHFSNQCNVICCKNAILSYFTLIIAEEMMLHAGLKLFRAFYENKKFAPDKFNSLIT